jgi:hypothetical protein
MGDCSEFLDLLAGRLSENGFSTWRNVKLEKYLLEIVASKVELSSSRGLAQSWAHFILATTMDQPQPESITDFAEYAFAYLLRNITRYMSGAGGGGANKIIIPVIVSQDFNNEIRDWIGRKIPAKHTNPFNFPVLMASSTKKICYCSKTPFFAALQWAGIAEFVGEQLGSP